ncbi:MAG: hypothetical protein ACE5KE_10740 [Methanosarcinales archaeon]
MNIDLSKIIRQERSSEKLQKLEGDFYKKVGEYLKSLEEEKAKLDPYSTKALIIEDELRTARLNIKNIIDRRLRKIIDKASLKASGYQGYIEFSIKEEEEIYKQVLESITKGKKKILNGIFNSNNYNYNSNYKESIKEELRKIDKKRDKEVDGKVENTEVKSEISNDIAINITTDNRDNKIKPDSENHIEYLIVRVLKDIPTFLGVDGRHYTLFKEDVVAIPYINAKVLCKRRVALPIKIKE